MKHITRVRLKKPYSSQFTDADAAAWLAKSSGNATPEKKPGKKRAKIEIDVSHISRKYLVAITRAWTDYERDKNLRKWLTEIITVYTYEPVAALDAISEALEGRIKVWDYNTEARIAHFLITRAGDILALNRTTKELNTNPLETLQRNKAILRRAAKAITPRIRGSRVKWRLSNLIGD